MKKAAFARVPLLLLLALALSTCGKGSASSPGGTTTAGNTVTMNTTNFDRHTITIKAGESVTFDNSNGAFHQICLGKDMQCSKSAKGPQEVEGDGFSINTGAKKTVTFADPGTYDIACSVHPNMNLTVTVQ
jgi:plastocyanin